MVLARGTANYSLGASGADIIFDDRKVSKRAGINEVAGLRLREQLEYLQVLNESGVSHIPTIVDSGIDNFIQPPYIYYTMPKYFSINYEDHPPISVAHSLRIILAEQFWSRKLPYVEVPDILWVHRLKEFLKGTPTEGFVEAAIEEYYRHLPSYVVIHGDPTLANCILNRDYVFPRDLDRSLIILDPIPPQGKIPSLRAVDLGKILQSLYGYEHMFFESFPVVSDSEIRKFVFSIPKEDQVLSLFFAAVHIERALPYHDDIYIPHLKGIRDRILGDLDVRI